jgi:hypothetical protein
MKRIIYFVLIFSLCLGRTFAQQEKGIIGSNNWLHNWTEFQPNQEDYGEPTEILTGNITKDTQLLKRNVYLLMGDVFVTNNATLTIEPGTVIIGDFDTKGTLIITKGATIVADGSETDPIVFTSNRSRKKPGDWGGLVILGEAPTNKFGNGSAAALFPGLSPEFYANTNYGGDNAFSHSGILRYVRIEYAGARIGRGAYFPSLLVAGAGQTTLIDHVMISYPAGKSIQVWGGDLEIKNAVSYKASDVDFEFNYGAQVVLNNSLAVRSPYASHSSGSKSIRIYSYDKESEVDFSKAGTKVVASNLTILNKTDDLEGDIEKGLIKEAVFVGHNASLDMQRSVISGFSPAVIFDSKVKVNQENLEKIKFSEMYFNNCNGNIYVDNFSNNDDLENWYGNPSFFNVYSKGLDSETFIDIYSNKNPDFRLRINQIMATNDIGGE